MPRTILIVAHRLSTVEKADRIIVFDKGRIVEEGTHKQLMVRKDGVYAGLVKCQMSNGNDLTDFDDSLNGTIANLIK